MYRELEYRFAFDDALRRIGSDPVGRKPNTFTPKYTDEERGDAQREFDPMVKILWHRLKMMSEKQATVLRACHNMRNSAFHRGEHNPSILKPVTELLFLTVVDLAREFPVYHVVLPNPNAKPDPTGFPVRFGVNPTGVGTVEGREKLCTGLVQQPYPFRKPGYSYRWHWS